MPNKALIIGVSSQDGSYLADLLLEKGYEVVGTIRRSTSFSKENLEHLYGRIAIEAADLTDESSLGAVIRKHRPHEVYNIGDGPVVAVVARSAADEWDRIIPYDRNQDT